MSLMMDRMQTWMTCVVLHFFDPIIDLLEILLMDPVIEFLSLSSLHVRCIFLILD